VIGPGGSYGTLPEGAKLLLTAGMLIGRLEIFTVLVMFSPSYWRS
jgi:trk system potassium uptake protein TrkH